MSSYHWVQEEAYPSWYMVFWCQSQEKKKKYGSLYSQKCIKAWDIWLILWWEKKRLPSQKWSMAEVGVEMVLKEKEERMWGNKTILHILLCISLSSSRKIYYFLLNKSIQVSPSNDMRFQVWKRLVLLVVDTDTLVRGG